MLRSRIIPCLLVHNKGLVKTVKFKEAYCLSYKEDFDAVSDEPLQTSIVISAKEISIKDTTYLNNWPNRG